MTNQSKPSPFHKGEREIQTHYGVREQLEQMGQSFIRSFMPDQHREFYQQLPYVFVGSIDTTGRPWASVLIGHVGFIQSPDAYTLRFDSPRIAGDPFNHNISPGSPVGLLGIQFDARRRNRLSAKVESVGDQSFELKVVQAFGNCPQYIQARVPYLQPEMDQVGEERPKSLFNTLSSRAKEIIQKADNFFIATHYSQDNDDASYGADMSHRGGRPGFVRVESDRFLTFPDFSGNFHFNSLGNIALNPRAGLLFIDFDSGDVVYLTCKAEIIYDSEEKRAFEGAERLVRFELDEGILIEKAIPIKWHFIDESPSLERTGTWEEVAETLAARKSCNVYRQYNVTRVERESDVITSFYLEPEGDEHIHCHKAGQFLPIEVQPPGQDKPVKRTYTISNAPNGSYYRLSIKREAAPNPDVPPGLCSNYFHQHIKTGSRVCALTPRGHFVLEENSIRPVVLLSAGVGITPMISMLEELVNGDATCGFHRKIWFIHGAISSKQHAFSDYVTNVAKDRPGVTTHYAYSKPSASDNQGTDYDSKGRVDIELLKSLLPFDDYDFYFCGPLPFMKSIYDGLKKVNVPDGRIHYEFFGPGVSLLNNPGENKALVGELENRQPVTVKFAKSDKQAIWDPAQGTLLDLAEKQGLRPAYSCRSGVCATCSTRIIEGNVGYIDPPLAEAEQDHALICCSYPGKQTGEGNTLILDL